ncbi:MAG TPA: DNA adenine methylase [Terriglobales bacterium]|nr:DNA adenine methylase [Terriglobales bacterium]
MIKYLGSKRLLVPRILAIARRLPGVRRAVDLFSGTARVGHALKRAGCYVIANDHLSYAATLARCYVAADRDRIGTKAERLIRDLARTKPRPGYFTETFCERSRFFHPKNGARIDAIRERIARLGVEPELEAVALVSLMEAADRVDSTTGVQMAYLKRWAPRALHDLELRMPQILPGPGEAHQLDAEEAAAVWEADLVYLDPPYNQHRYLGNYHVWETLVRWDAPEVYGTACKRVDCRSYSSAFNSRPRIAAAMRRVLRSLRCRYVIASFNNEGYLSRREMTSLLGEVGRVHVLELDFKRYVGAQIGIFNPRGVKVGRVSHLRNKEYLFVVGRDSAPLPDALGRLASSWRRAEQIALL